MAPGQFRCGGARMSEAEATDGNENGKQAEPPSWSAPTRLLIGRDRRGNWVVRDPSGARGGLFVNRAAAFKYARSETGKRLPAVVMVRAVLELDIHGPTKTQQALSLDHTVRRRRIA